MTPSPSQHPDATVLRLPHFARAAGGRRTGARAPAPTTARLALWAAAGVSAATVATVLGARSDVLADPALNGAYRGAAILSWVGVGLHTWRRRPGDRLGPLMIAAGFAFAATAPMALADPALFTLGRLAWVALAALLAYVLVGFPHGRIASRRTRRAFRVACGAVAALWTVLLLGARELPAGGVLTRCDGACPPNPYRVGELDGALAAAVADAATLATSALLLLVAWLVLRHMRAAQGPARAALGFPFACLFAFALLVGVSNALRATGDEDPLALALGWAGVLAGLAVPWALLVGQMRGRLLAGALLLRRNAALEAELRATAQELRASRARIFSAAAQERRRIERDLHDGGQNRLVALRIKLELAAEEAGANGAPAQLQRTLAGLRDEAQEALDAVRAIAHGIYPPLLAGRGLAAALEAEVAQAPLPGRVLGGETVRRSTPEAEAAVWFCCLEALQNAGKHAGAQAHVTVRLDGGRETLAFSVADDGCGFAIGDGGGAVAGGGAAGNGAGAARAAAARAAVGAAGARGLTHMRDRALAVGGTLDVAAAPGRGTVVRGRVPWPPREEGGAP